eukprot:GSChrysophyteH1.ASY1.ANO1.1282.1 assembled CDS
MSEKAKTEMIENTAIARDEPRTGERRHSLHKQLGITDRIRQSSRTLFRKEELPFFCPDCITIESDRSGELHYNLKNWYECLFVTLEHPETCLLGIYIHRALLATIAINVCVSILMTLPAFKSHFPSECDDPVCDNTTACVGERICTPTVDPTLINLDRICVYIFTADYLVRMMTCIVIPIRLSGTLLEAWDEEEYLLAELEDREPDQDPPQPPLFSILFSYAILPRNIIDLVAILPTYIEMFAPNTVTGLSFIRVTRLLRSLRAGALITRNNDKNDGVVWLLIHVVKSTIDVIFYLLFIGLMIVFIFGIVIYDFESGTYVRDKDTHETPFQSAFSGMYWAVTTMTTVGYGDMFPTTQGGKVVAAVLMIIGLLFMSLPIAIVGSKVTLGYEKLSERIEKRERWQQMRDVKMRVSEVSGVTFTTVPDLPDSLASPHDDSPNEEVPSPSEESNSSAKKRPTLTLKERSPRESTLLKGLSVSTHGDNDVMNEDVKQEIRQVLKDLENLKSRLETLI